MIFGPAEIEFGTDIKATADGVQTINPGHAFACDRPIGWVMHLSAPIRRTRVKFILYSMNSDGTESVLQEMPLDIGNPLFADVGSHLTLSIADLMGQKTASGSTKFRLRVEAGDALLAEGDFECQPSSG